MKKQDIRDWLIIFLLSALLGIAFGYGVNQKLPKQETLTAKK